MYEPTTDSTFDYMWRHEKRGGRWYIMQGEMILAECSEEKSKELDKRYEEFKKIMQDTWDKLIEGK